jgi:hypothetical protein
VNIKICVVQAAVGVDTYVVMYLEGTQHCLVTIDFLDFVFILSPILPRDAAFY